MAKVFFDTNFLIQFYSKKPPIDPVVFEKYDLFVSTLSYHILAYLQKIKIPNKELIELMDGFLVVDFEQKILKLALSGPTSDLEDNVQLHCAAEAGCDYFLTHDQKLLNMKFFGKAAIVSRI